jgi:peptidoglycan/xylan/chitin deacetylase (PgdA/CDA1 family)
MSSHRWVHRVAPLFAIAAIAGCSSAPVRTVTGRRAAAQAVLPLQSTTSIASVAPSSTTASVEPPAGPPAPEPAAPTLDGEAAQPPPASVQIPPAAFIGDGVPQPGSFFQSLLDDHSLDGRGKFVALTFDDGPGPYTRQIVDVLNIFGVKGTFFQISNQTGGHAELVRYMQSSGMHLASHSKSHAHLEQLTAPEQADQVVGAADAQDRVLGPGTTKCFRPPYGQYDQAVLDLVAGRGLATAMWSVDTDDWKKPGLPTIVVRALTAAKDRSIILLHDGGGDRSETIQALPWIIEGLRRKGFTILPIC